MHTSMEANVHHTHAPLRGHAHSAESHAHLDASQWALRAGLFAAMAAFFARLWLTGTLGYYINIRFAWLSVVAMIVFVVLALTCLAAFLQARRGRADFTYGFHEMAGHMHPRVTVPILLVLAAPLAIGLLVPARPLGASAVGGDLLPASASESGASAPANSLDWTVVDWLRVFYYSGNPDRLNAREADVVGFVYRRDADPSGHFMVARFVMSCCSADAAAVGMPVAWTGAADIPTDRWVRVQGAVKVQQFGKNTLPVIEARSVEQLPGPPPQPYLYP